MTKYQPKHAFVKELGLRGMFAEAADAAADSAGTLVKNSSLTEVMTVGTWAMLATALYASGTTRQLMRTYTAANDAAQVANNGPFGGYNPASWGLNIGFIYGTEMWKQFIYLIDPVAAGVLFDPNTPPEEKQNVENQVLVSIMEVAVSMVLAYVILNYTGDLVNLVSVLAGKVS